MYPHRLDGTAVKCVALTLFMLVMAGCVAKPDTRIAERSITDHFEQRGYLVKHISIGRISRNPIAEREYMAPLTYVVEVPSIVLEPKDPSGGASGYPEPGELAFSGAYFKIQALSPPKRGWVVSQVTGVGLP